MYCMLGDKNSTVRVFLFIFNVYACVMVCVCVHVHACGGALSEDNW